MQNLRITSEAFSNLFERIISGDSLARTVLFLALGQFLFFTWITLDQPIVDLWGFRPAQTAAPVPYMLHDGAWLATIIPLFGEPWILPIEFPFYQWCVAFVVWLTGAPIDPVGRLISAFFAIATLWPIALLLKSTRLDRRTGFLIGALWLCAPVVIFFGRSFLIETASVFLAITWLAFYVRLLASARYLDYFVCLTFGLLAAVVKLTAFVGIAIVGFVFTCIFLWPRRRHLIENLQLIVLAGSTVLLPVIALLAWGRFASAAMGDNPLAMPLRTENLTSWFFGTWADRWGLPLWNWTVRFRALPEALGVAWFAALYPLLRLGPRRRSFWISLTLILGYLSAFLVFPTLHIHHFHYQTENAILVCAAAAVGIGGLLRSRHLFEGYAVFAILFVGQLWTFYSGTYFGMLMDDRHDHPYYKAGIMLKELTPPDSVIVVFGTDYGADLPYFADRRGIVPANWFSPETVRKVVFEERLHWFGGRKLGAVIDCAVYSNIVISPKLVPIRDQLKHELGGQTIEVTGSPLGATVSTPKCEISLQAKATPEASGDNPQLKP